MTSYPQRRLRRIQGYDYPQGGAYFVTVCIQHRKSLLGRIDGERVALTPAGIMVQSFWDALAERFDGVELDAFVVMPEHLHGILLLRGRSFTLMQVMTAYKSLTTVEYGRGVKHEGWPRYTGSLWQRGYYDRVIRDEEELNTIRAYIDTNPRRRVLRAQQG
jgi:putative transposase